MGKHGKLFIVIGILNGKMTFYYTNIVGQKTGGAAKSVQYVNTFLKIGGLQDHFI